MTKYRSCDNHSSKDAAFKDESSTVIFKLAIASMLSESSF